MSADELAQFISEGEEEDGAVSRQSIESSVRPSFVAVPESDEVPANISDTDEGMSFQQRRQRSKSEKFRQTTTNCLIQ